MASPTTRRLQALLVLALGVVVLVTLPRSRTLIGQVVGSSPYCDGLVAYWKLDEKTGNIAKDSVSCNDAIVRSPTVPQWQADHPATSPSTAVNAGSIHIGPSTGIETPFHTPSTFTWSAWVRYAPKPRSDVPTTNPNAMILFSNNSDGHPGIRLLIEPVYNRLSMTNYEGYGNTGNYYLPNDSSWVHIALVRKGDRVDDGYRLYVNGTISVYNPVGISPTGRKGNPPFPLQPVHYSGNIWIGSSNQGSTPFPLNNFYGDIDDVRIYERALSDAEIQGLARGEGYDLSCIVPCSVSSSSSSSSAATCCNLVSQTCE